MNPYEEIVCGMMDSDLPSDYWRWCREIRLTPHGFPELDATRQVMQRNDQSVWDHTMSVIDTLEVRNPITLLSGLFHDLGKCNTETTNSLSSSRFSGHEVKSCEIAIDRLTQWETPVYIIDGVFRLISTHMFDIKNVTKEKTIRKFVASVGRDNIENWFVLRIADSLSYSKPEQYRDRLIEPFRKVVMSYLDRQPTSEQLEFEKSGGIRIEGGDES